MLEYLKGLNKPIMINDILYNDVSEIKNISGDVVIKINLKRESETSTTTNKVTEVETVDIFRIKVRQYMTKPPVPDFDFHTEWNNGIPMPFRIMTGKKIKETKGMIYMQLWAEMESEVMTHCMKCGRVLTNDVSKFFGIGPECGGHGYNNPFETKEELHQAVAEVKKQLAEIRWEGWIIKSAIEEEEVIRKETK